MSISLRPATAADAKKIRDLIREVRINPMNLDWERFIVAEDDGKFVGCVQVKPHSDGVRELASLAVSPSRQGQGIGAMLVKALLQREKGELYLMCREKTAAYYRRFGFVEVSGADIPRSFRLHARAGRLIAMFAGEGLAFMKRKTG